jgi:hypothetical protein
MTLMFVALLATLTSAELAIIILLQNFVETFNSLILSRDLPLDVIDKLLLYIKQPLPLLLLLAINSGEEWHPDIDRSREYDVEFVSLSTVVEDHFVLLERFQLQGFANLCVFLLFYNISFFEKFDFGEEFRHNLQFILGVVGAVCGKCAAVAGLKRV